MRSPFITLVEASSNEPPSQREFFIDSHISPKFSDVNMRLQSLHISKDGAKLFAKLNLSGTVTSGACDLVAGDQGTIREIKLIAHMQPDATIPMKIVKAGSWHSFEQPYPMRASFATELDVEISTGTNRIDLTATDLVPGFRLTGKISFSLVISVELPPAPPKHVSASGYIIETKILGSPDSSNDIAEEEPPTRHDFGSYTLLSWQPTFYSQSTGGESHIYYLRVDGDRDLVARLHQKNPALIALGPDNEYYLAGPDGYPEPNVLGVAVRSTALLQPVSDAGTFESGFLEGFVYRRAAFACGSLQLLRNEGLGSHLAMGVYIPHHTAHCLGIQHEKLSDWGNQISEFSSAVRAVYDYLMVAKDRDTSTACSIISQDWEKFYSQSAELAGMGYCALDLVDGIYEDLGTTMSPARLGEIQGRVCCETLFYLLTESDPEKCTKEAIYSKFKHDKLLENESPTLIDRIEAEYASLPNFS